MIRYRLLLNVPASRSESDRTVTVSIDAAHGDEVNDLIWTGLDWAVDHAQRVLEQQRGLANQLLDSRTSPRHLARGIASAQMAAFKPVLECGADLLKPREETKEQEMARVASGIASTLLLHLPNLRSSDPHARAVAVDVIESMAREWREGRALTGSQSSPDNWIEEMGRALVREIPMFASQLESESERFRVLAAISVESARQLAEGIDRILSGDEKFNTVNSAASFQDRIDELIRSMKTGS